jgi:hypothetical protein
MKRGDTAPALRAELTDNGEPIDLTPATVKVIGKRNGAAVFSRAATTKTNLGVVTMAWGPTDTMLPGLISIEIELTWANGDVQTLPSNGYLQVLVDPDLG